MVAVVNPVLAIIKNVIPTARNAVPRINMFDATL
jgi:hypothetical protein